MSFKGRVKDIMSRLRLRSTRRDSAESRSVIPRPIDTDQTFTTPSHPSTQSGQDPLPNQANIATSNTPQVDESLVSAFKSSEIDPQQSPRQSALSLDSDEADFDNVAAEILELGITGADLTLPLFDGTSTNPDDYLIDFESDSMEKYPDVRIYFWFIGDTWRAIDNIQGTAPTDRQARLTYDQDLVREGREYLRASKARGEGCYLSRDREFLAENQPGKPWYRFPTIAIVEKIRTGDVARMAEEGRLAGLGDERWCIDELAKTNIRVPIIWASMFKPGVVPGTKGWYKSLAAAYYYDAHPAPQVFHGKSRHDAMTELLSAFCDPRETWPCSRRFIWEVLEADWPGLREQGETKYEGEKLTPAETERLEKHMGNMGDFFYGKKEYRQKKKFFGLSFSFR